jgi:hypothetical protein
MSAQSLFYFAAGGEYPLRKPVPCPGRIGTGGMTGCFFFEKASAHRKDLLKFKG